MSTVEISVIVIAVVFVAAVAIVSIYRKIKGKGGCSCCKGCSSCRGCGHANVCDSSAVDTEGDNGADGAEIASAENEADFELDKGGESCEDVDK